MLKIVDYGDSKRISVGNESIKVNYRYSKNGCTDVEFEMLGTYSIRYLNGFIRV